jgi:hypothetical protein
MDWTTRESWLDYGVEQEIFLVSMTSRSATGPTQPSIQRVPRAVSPGIKRQGREAASSPPCSVEAENGGALRSSIRLHGVILN